MGFGGHAPAGETPGAAAACARLLRRGTLDRLLAAGMDPAWDPELGLRAAQITAAKRRRALSASLEAAVREATEPPR